MWMIFLTARRHCPPPAGACQRFVSSPNRPDRCAPPSPPGGPYSGGAQLKHKFVESASFLVTACNARRRVTLGLHDKGGALVPAGKLTIPPNHSVPAASEVVEVRYLYAFKESGAIYQPVYRGNPPYLCAR